jgi:hypothetical protein
VDDVDDDGSFGVDNFGAEVGLGEREVVRLSVSVGDGDGDGIGVGVGVAVGIDVGVDEAFWEQYPSSPQYAIGVQH